MHLSYGKGQDEKREKLWNYARLNSLIGLDKREVYTDWNCLPESKKRQILSQERNWFGHFKMFCNEMQNCVFLGYP
jgi:hypothetical protein